MIILHVISLFFWFLGIVTSIYLLLEIVSQLFSRYMSDRQATGIAKGTLMDPAFSKPDSYDCENTWYEDYCQDVESMFPKFKPPFNRAAPLGLWVAPRYNGTHINVDKHNLRRTILSRKTIPEKPSLSVFFLGGSTTWGWGARDAFTIPSQLALLNPNLHVENHAQLGYVSSQEVITLIQLLKKDVKPDVIIFIDGLNDIYSAYQSGIAGIEQNALSRKLRLEAKVGASLSDIYKERSAVYKLLKTKKTTGKKSMGYLSHSLASEIIKSYKQNVELVKKIAGAYDIEPFFIWQPMLFGKPLPTTYERNLLSVINPWKPLWHHVTDLINKGCFSDKRVFNLSELFSNEKQPIYIDPWHYNETANKMIAKAVADILEKR